MRKEELKTREIKLLYVRSFPFESKNKYLMVLKQIFHLSKLLISSVF